MVNNQSVFSAEVSIFRTLPSHSVSDLLAQSMFAVCSRQPSNVKPCVIWLTWTALHCSNMKTQSYGADDLGDFGIFLLIQVIILALSVTVQLLCLLLAASCSI